MMQRSLTRLQPTKPVLPRTVAKQQAHAPGSSIWMRGRARPGIAALICALMSFVAVGAGMAADAEALLTPMPDKPAAPAFELAGPDGERYRLADFRGQPLIVNFWATWCPPCRAEMPSMQRAWEQLEAEGIGIIAINVGEDAETVQAFLEQVPVSFPLPLDTDSQVTQSWPLRGLPTTFVVGPDGRLIYKATGEREWDDPELLDQVRALKTD